MPPTRLGAWRAVAALLLATLPGGLALVLHSADARPAAGAGQLQDSSRGPLGDIPAIARDVERLRGLRFRHIPPVRLVGRRREHQIVARARAKAKRQQGAESARVEAAKRAQRASLAFARLSGFVGSGFKLHDAGRSLEDAVLGGFRPGRRRIVLFRNPAESPEALAVTIAHELDHALDYQNAPRVFEREGPGTADEPRIAAQALIEGTATVVAARFARQHGYASIAAGGKLFSIENSGYGVPPALAATFRFPYTSGARFVRTLYRRARGWRLVNDAFRRPPVSTAQILHPRLRAGPAEFRQVKVDASPGPRWRLVGRTDSGELDVQILLALALPADAAVADTRGLTGGGLATWTLSRAGGCRQPCRRGRASVLVDRWRTPFAAARFLGDLPGYLQSKLHAHRLGSLAWRIGGGSAALAIDGDATAMAFGPSPAITRRLAGEAARSAK